MSIVKGLACLVVVVVLSGFHLDASQQDVVTIDSGQLSGTASTGGVRAFLGIPFAAPPVGDLRWRPPQPVAKWTGVRKADQFGTSCMQTQGVRLPWTEEFMTQGPVGEDCLFLNVWTSSSANARAPVMVYLYGGGFNEGAGSIAVYDGAALARKGVVVVTLNYRVGVLGFFSHSDLTRESEHHSSGNYGILDQIAALQWVHRNIAAFGGDPGAVTIFGQSAGALSVYGLMRSPLAKGLFVRAIAQSGPGLLGANALGGTSTQAERDTAGVAYAASKGAKTLAELRALPASTFLGGGGRGTPGAPAAPTGMFRDGWVIPMTDPASQAPIMLGMTANDIGVVGGLGGGRGATAATVDTYKADAARLYGDKAAAFLAAYPVGTDADIPAARLRAGQDRARVSIDLWSADQLKVSPRIYTYFLSRAIPWPEHPEFGAFHTSDVPYIFGTIHKLNRPWEPTDEKLSDAMSTYWTNFAKTGDPNGAGVPRWPAYDATSHQTMELGANMGPMAVAGPAQLEFQISQLKK